MKISLLVLRCKNIDVSKEFYEGLGLVFKKEKHGSGPEHYSSENDDSVFELYPTGNTVIADNTRLGLKISDFQQVIRRQDIHSTYEIKGSTIYVLTDPDGRKVEISQHEL